MGPEDDRIYSAYIKKRLIAWGQNTSLVRATKYMLGHWCLRSKNLVVYKTCEKEWFNDVKCAGPDGRRNKMSFTA